MEHKRIFTWVQARQGKLRSDSFRSNWENVCYHSLQNIAYFKYRI